MFYLLIFLLVTLLLVMIPGRRVAMYFTGVIVFSIAAFTSIMSISVLSGNPENAFMQFITREVSPLIICDKLSAFFIIVINFTVLSGFIYSIGYLRPYITGKPSSWIRLHYLALTWLHTSMVLVTLIRDGFGFIMVWEIMTISSFILVIFDFDAKGTIKAGISYLVQMHVGMLFIFGALIISSGGFNNLSFDNLKVYFTENQNWPVFLLFFLGFGLKAGFFLLHTWLPDAHPAAPSHVSGIMSGVMIKLGIYGIMRVSVYLVNDMLIIGVAMIIISAITGLFGVMMAILQHDIKKLLAYHSIENIGIIGIGAGLGIYGSAIGNPVVSAAGYAGALLHTLNHSLFKSLLFYSAGSVIGQLHTRNIEKMGGLMKYMPYTAWAFLIGAVAISGIPPLNGFISEFLLYSSIVNGMGNTEFYPLLVFFIALLSLVLIGGLALLCFTKVFSVVFLGQSRTEFHTEPFEVGKSMLLAKLIPVIPILLIGFLPFLIIDPLLNMSNSIFGIGQQFPEEFFSSPMRNISICTAGLVLLAITIAMIRKLLLSSRKVLTGPTWGCGYSAVGSRQQYTATSFVQEYAALIKPVIKTGHTNINYSSDEVFPGRRDFHTHSDDFVRSRLINKPADFIVNILRRAAVFQTGKLQHYVLLVLLFLIIIFLLTYLKLI
jgi:formate hydrogenlyase subunit 3/multisubunit Na+/H+ antiporter MnhD subunit